jgi:glycosidase
MWVPDAVFYQIFPDRFRREPEPWTANPDQPAGNEPCGGNLAGIRAAIPYLANLGVTALYLTPIFHASSYHKYDTIDYFTVDPAFGSNDDFRDLVSALHDRGIRIVLDGVFNHCSDRHPFFLDAAEKGAASEYWDWFTVDEDRIVQDPEPNYARWAGVRTMPDWNHRNPAVVDYLLSVVRHWIAEYGIDGWRLDTTEYLPPDFVRAIYRTARALSPEVYVLGEVMGLGTPWFKHDALDGVMHYKLWEALTAFLAEERWDAQAFAHSVHAHWHSYPEDANHGSYTLLSSHDRPRFLTQCSGDTDRLRLALAFQFTFPGAPAVYYGDEIGLEGRDDPDNRRCFPWDESTWDRSLYDDVRRLIAMRQEEPALRSGSIRFLETGGRFLSYERALGDERFLVALNADRHADAVLHLPPGEWAEPGSDKREREDLTIPTLSSCILKLVG